MVVRCAAYQNGKRTADIQVQEISEYLTRPNTFVWVALVDPDATELKVMSEEFQLHPLAVEDAQHGHQNPKIEEYGDSLFVVLQTPQLDSAKELFVGEVDIFAAKNYILTVRKNTEQGFTAVRERCEREPKFLKHGSAFVLYALIDAVVDRYFPIEEQFERDLEAVEGKIFSNQSHLRANIQALYDLKRQIMVLQHATAPLADGLLKLFGGRVPEICISMQDYYRDVFDHLQRITKNIDSLREVTSTALQVNLSMIALSESEVSKKLASYGALFAVPTAIAGIYGMNFQYMPELKSAWGYPIVMTIIVIADILLWLRFRRAGWM